MARRFRWAGQLVRHHKLTDYQAEELLAARGPSLVLGDYVLLGRLGAGGMGQVFRARHRHMEREVVIKLLPTKMADIYSLGCTFFRLLTGRVPYEVETLIGKLLAHREGPIPSLRMHRPDEPAGVDDAFRRMLTVEDGRFVKGARPPSVPFSDCAFQPGGSRIAAPAQVGFEFHPTPVWTADGHIAGTLHLDSSERDVPSRVWNTSAHPVNSVAWSPDGSQLVSGRWTSFKNGERAGPAAEQPRSKADSRIAVAAWSPSWS